MGDNSFLINSSVILCRTLKKLRPLVIQAPSFILFSKVKCLSWNELCPHLTFICWSLILQCGYTGETGHLGRLSFLSFWSLSCVCLFVTPWTMARQLPLSMGFPSQEYWSGLPFPSPGVLPDPGIEPTSPGSQQNLYCLSHLGSPWRVVIKAKRGHKGGELIQ